MMPAHDRGWLGLTATIVLPDGRRRNVVCDCRRSFLDCVRDLARLCDAWNAEVQAISCPDSILSSLGRRSIKRKRPLDAQRQMRRYEAQVLGRIGRLDLVHAYDNRTHAGSASRARLRRIKQERLI